MRRALSQTGGRVELWASPGWDAEPLAAALRVGTERDRVLRHVHGFHSYPARMHPDTAAGVIRALGRPGARVLDPFMGSGTVLVEARLAGLRAFGVDANPLAVELAWLKSGGLSAEECGDLPGVATAVAERAEARRQIRAGSTRRYGSRDRELFDPHVLLELDGLRASIEDLLPPPSNSAVGPAAGALRRVLRLVLSSILTKVSRQPGDTATETVPRRLASGFTIRHFLERATLLTRQLEELHALLPARAPASQVEEGDARRLTGLADASIQLVVTSPPYPGVYDYYAQHATRLRWLELDAAGFEQRELGARRRLAALAPAAAIAAWERELGDSLGALRRVLAPSGVAALLIADSALGELPLFADDTLGRLAPRQGLSLVVRASQARPHFHAPTRAVFRRRPRREHLLLLSR